MHPEAAGRGLKLKKLIMIARPSGVLKEIRELWGRQRLDAFASWSHYCITHVHV